MLRNWLKNVSKSFASRNNRHLTKKTRRSQLKLERLECREVPAAYTWLPTAAGTYDWTNPANWSGGTSYPSVAGDTANITTALTGNETLNLNGATTLAGLTIGASSGTDTFTIAAGTSGSLSLSGTVAKTSGGADQITAPLVFTGTTLTLNNSAAASPLTFTNTVAPTATALSVNGTAGNTGEIDFTAANALTSTGAVTVNAGVLGINSITLSSSNVLTIASGATVDSSGTLSTKANTSSTYSAVVGNGSGASIGTLKLTGTGSTAASPDIFFNSNEQSNASNNYGSRIAARVDLNGGQRYVAGETNHNGIPAYGTNGDTVFTKPIIDSVGGGNLIFAAPATYTGGSNPMEVPFYLASANTFTDPVQIQRGSVYLGNATALTQGNALSFSPASGNNARFYLFGHNATVSNLSSTGAGNALIANTAGGGGSYPAVSLTVNETANTTFGGTIVQDQPEYYSSLTGTSGALSLVKTGSGTLTLSGTNSYAGSTSVTAGTLSVAADANLGADPTGPTPGNIVLNGGTLLANSSFTLNSARGIAVGPASGTGTGEIDVAAGQTLSYAGTIANNGTGTGTLVIGSGSSNGTFAFSGSAGAVTVNAGTLGGSGTVGALVDNATINPGLGGVSTLNTGSLSFGSTAIYAPDLNGAGSNDELSVNGTITLTGATLQPIVNYTPNVGDSFTIIHNVTGAAITTEFKSPNGALLGEGNYFVSGGHLFQITYRGNGNNDVVITAVASPVYYVEADGWSSQYNGTSWTGIVGQMVPDADPVQANAQPASFGGATAVANSGHKAFTSVNAALSQIADDNAVGATLIDNGGVFAEDVVLSQPVALQLQYANSTFNSLADTVSNASLQINGVTLTTGDTLNTTISSAIGGTGSLVKAGSGTLTLGGANSYAGTTEVAGGILKLGSASAIGVNPAVTVDAAGTLSLNGHSYAFGSLSSAGTLQNASATPATLTVSTATANVTLAGVIQDGTGGGALSLTANGSGTLTLSGVNNSYTGATVDNGGTLAVAELANSHSNSSIGAASNAAANLVLNGATLLYTGTDVAPSTDHNLTFGGSNDAITVQNAGTTLSLAGNITGGSAVAFTSNGPGTLFFTSGNTTYTGSAGLNGVGSITVASGNLQSAALTINEGRTLSIGSGASFTANGTLFINAPTDTDTTVITGPGTLNLNVAGSSIADPDIYASPEGGNSNYAPYIAAPVNLGSGNHVIEVQSNNNGYSTYAGDLRLNGQISGTSSSVLTVYGLPQGQDAVLVLAADNSTTFAGSVNIVRGAVTLANPNALTAANSVTFSPTGTNNALLYLFGNSVTIGNLSSATTGNSFIRNGSGPDQGLQQNSTLTVTQTAPGTFSGVLADGPDDHRAGDVGTYQTLTLVKTGPATLTLTGNNAYTGSTTISGGTLSVPLLANGGTSATNGIGNSPSGIGSSSNAANNLVLDGGTLQYTGSAVNTDRLFTVTSNGGAIDASGAGPIDFTNTGSDVFSGSSNATLTLTGNNAGANTLSANLSDSGAQLALVKQGAGTWIVNGTETNTGGTTVSAGTLIDNGTIGNVTVNGGTLAGTGTAGAVIDNATINPGTSASATGIFNTGNLSFGATGVYTADLNGAAAAGTSYDQLRVTGAINLTGATLNLNVNYVPTVGDSYTIIHNFNAATITGNFKLSSGQQLHEGDTFFVGGQLFQITYQGNGTNDVVIEAVLPPTYYVEADAWTSQPGAPFSVGQTIPDADPVASGPQPAKFGGSMAAVNSGYKAFTSVNAALAQVADDGAVGAQIVVNRGIYSEDVLVNQDVTLKLQDSNISFGSLAGTSTSATINLSGITFTEGSDNSSTQFAGNIVGGGSLIKAGSGTFTVSGNDIYSGTTEVAGGILRTGSSTGLSGNSAATVDVGAKLQLNGFNATLASLAGSGTVEDANATSVTLSTGSLGSNFAGVLQDGLGGGTLAVVKTGSGLFSLSGTNTYTGGTSIAAGTLQLGTGGTTGSIVGNVSDSGTLAFDTSTNLSFGATISGPGGILQTGTNVVTLSGPNSYVGGTVVNSGTLRVGSATALGNASAVTVNAAGDLQLNGTSIAIGGLSGAGTIEDANAAPATLTVNTAGGATTFSGVLQDGAGGGALSVTVTGGNALTLSGTNNSYSGATTINGGTTLDVMALANGGAASSIGASANTAANLVLQGGSTLEYIGVAAAPSTDRSFTLGAGGGVIGVQNATTVLTIGGNATGGTGFTSDGPGTLAFSNGNATYSGTNGLNGAGGITVNSGDLQTAAMTVSSGNQLKIASGATFTANGTIYITAPYSSYAHANLISGPGTLKLNVANPSTATPDIFFGPENSDEYGANISATIDFGSSNHVIEVQSNNDDYANYGGDLVLDGPIEGTSSSTLTLYGLLRSQDATLVLSADNSSTFQGSVNIARGALELLNSNALTAANSVAFSPAAGNNALLYLFGDSVTIGSLGSGTAGNDYVRNGSVSTAATLTVDQTTAGTFGGIIADGPDDHRAGESGNYQPLSLVKTGSATLTLTGANAYTGSTTVSGGVLSVTSLANGGTGATYGIGNSPSGIGSATNAASNLVLDGGTLQYTGPAVSTDRLFTVTGNGGSIDASGTGAVTFSNTGNDAFSGSSNATLTLTGASTAANTLAGVLSDNGGSMLMVVKQGAGTWDLTGANNYTGGTAVSAGTLVDSGTIGAVTLNGGILEGTGTTGPISSSGVVYPGNAGVGILNSGSLSFGPGGSFTETIDGTTAGAASGGYNELAATGTINLTNAALNINLGYTPSVGDSYTLIHNVSGAAITGTFTYNSVAVPEGGYVFAGGARFQITYKGNGTNDVVLTAASQPTYYVEADGWSGEYNGGTWTGQVGQTVPDADPVATGAQPAKFGGGSAVIGSGYKAFTSVDAALAQAADDSAVGAKIVVNHGAYNEAVVVNQAVNLVLQDNSISFGSLADTVNSDALTINGITFTTGGDNSSTQFSGQIAGAGNLVKSGSGTFTAAGNNTYSGTTEVGGGVLKLGSSAALGNTSSVQVDAGATLRLNGFSSTIGGLSGAGTVENASATPATLTANATGTTFSGVLQNGAGAGPLSFATTGAGAFTLSGNASSYTGSTTVAGGTLNVADLEIGGHNSSIGASSNAVGNLVIASGGTVVYTGPTAATDRGFTVGTGGGAFDTSTAGATLTVSGNIANGSNNLTVGGAGNTVYNGVFTGTTGTLTKNDAGTVDFATNGALNPSSPSALATGNINVNAGTLGLGTLTLSGSRVVTIAANAVVNSTGTLDLSADASQPETEVAGLGTLNLASTMNSPTSPDVFFNYNDVDGAHSNYGTIIAANINLGSSQRYIFAKSNHNGLGEYGLGADAIISGSISGSAGFTYIAQDNFSDMEVPLVLDAANSFGGTLEIDRGSVYLWSAGAFPTGDDLVFNTHNGNSAKLFLLGNNTTVSNLTSEGDGSGTQLIANGNVSNNPAVPSINGGTSVPAAVLTINETSNTEFDGNLFDTSAEYDRIGGSIGAGSLSVVKTGPATLTMTANLMYSNTTSTPYTGSTTISAGTLDYTNLPAWPSAASFVLDGGTLQYTGALASTGTTAYSLAATANGGALDASGPGPLTLASSGTVTFTGATPTTLTLTGANTGLNTLAAAVADGAAATSVTKTGAGTWDLTGTDTYSGATTVSAGELLVDGSLTSPVTVAAGAILGGATGTIAAPVVINGALTPGDSSTTTGDLSVGNLSFGSGGAYNVLLNGATAGSGFDQVTGTGTVNLTGSTLHVSLGSGYTPTAGTSFDILVNNGGSAVTGTFTQGSSIVVNGITFNISYTGGTSHHDVVLTVAGSTPISIASININAGTAPIISASESGNIVTITTDGPHGFAAGDPIVIANVNSSYNGKYTIATVPTIYTFTINFGSVTGLTTVTDAGVAVDSADAGGLLVNGVAASGHSASYNSQRSMVDSIVYKFNEAVNLGSNAFTITPTGGNPGTVPSVSYLSPDGGLTWVVTFSGAGVTGNSIANGEYQIVLNSSAVTAVTGGGTLAGSDSEKFYRLFGDTSGNGHYRVSAPDRNTFNGSFGVSSTNASFLAYLDSNDDGRVNAVDRNSFNGDFGVRYSNFTATI